RAHFPEMRNILVATVLMLIAGRAGAQDACPGGAFQTYGRANHARLPQAPRIVINPQGEIPLDIICPPKAADFAVTARGFTVVKAFWPGCGIDGQLGALRIRARITPDCNRMFGFVRDPNTGIRKWFKAARQIECGDGIVEGDEQCDDGNIANGDCCSADCRSETGCQTP